MQSRKIASVGRHKRNLKNKEHSGIRIKPVLFEESAFLLILKLGGIDMKINFNYEVVACAEIDKFAFASAKELLDIKDCINMWDVRNVLRYQLPAFNCLFAGFPCQSLSLIGKGAGVSWTCECGHTYNPLDLPPDRRFICPECGCESENRNETPSSLIVYVLKAIELYHPNLVILENVANLLSAKFKPLFNQITREIASYGYNVYAKKLNARDYGSVQNRNRVIIVCVKKTIDNGRFKFPKPFAERRNLQDILEDCTDVFADTNASVVIDGKVPPYIKPAICKEIGYLVESEKDTYILPCKSGWSDHVIGINSCPTLRASNSTCLVMQKVNLDGKQRYYIKKMTPKERWLATGYSAEDYEKVAKTTSTTQLCHQTGNSISVEMLVEVFRSIYTALPHLFIDMKITSLFMGIGAFEKALSVFYAELNQ